MLGTMTSVRLRAHGLTDRGRVRPTNQDCFAIREPLGLLVVADGMGGHSGGEIAARLAVDAVVDLVAATSDTAGFERAGTASRSDLAQQRGRPGSDPLLSPADLEIWPFGFDHTLSADGNLLRTAVYLADVRVR